MFFVFCLFGAVCLAEAQTYDDSSQFPATTPGYSTLDDPGRVGGRQASRYHPNRMQQPNIQHQNKYKGVRRRSRGRFNPKRKNRHVPVILKKKKKKKKMKIVAVIAGFFIPGGVRMFGNFKSLKSCQKACSFTPTCFAGDFDPGLKTCYMHSNLTACGLTKPHNSIVHFKKIPCEIVESPISLVTLGTKLFRGLYQKNLKSLESCLKFCTTAGGGIASSVATVATTPQLCFGIDYDFQDHTCFHHFDSTLCTGVDPVLTPVRLTASPSTVNILICPFTV